MAGTKKSVEEEAEVTEALTESGDSVVSEVQPVISSEEGKTEELLTLDEWAKKAKCGETVKKIMSLMTKKGVKKTDSEWEALRSEIETKRI